MVFIESPAFTRYVPEYLDDDQYRLLQNELASNTDAGDLVQGTGGFRKFRWIDSRRGKGRKGGLRIIYYYFPSDQHIWLMTLYGKDEAADLTAKQKQLLKASIDTEIKAREAKRLRRESKLRNKQ